MSLHPPTTKSVIVVGDGYAAKNTLQSLVARHGGSVTVVAGVSNPETFTPMAGVIPTKANMWDKYALAETLKERNYARLFLVLPGHADRLHVDNDAASLDESPPPLPLLAQAPMVRRISSTSVRNNVSSDHSSASGGSQDVSDPSKCLRIQRRNIVEGWFPMKVKIVQFSLPSFDPKSRAGKPVNATSDNGISLLEQALMGPYHSKVATASGIPTTPVDDSHVAGSSQLPDDGTLLNKAPTVWQEYLESLVPPGETVEVPKEISFTASPTPLAPAAVAPVHHLMLPTSTVFPSS
ncbi:expressed unknown protein [Seminavis robusta]|uniref:Uncharacterized protein n=1 Tax=Seminavis robusta TaxID=568900 RepID=A0A9N8DY46_9STRA|nr:expressed unknown protein [Seminavis robusta]|eukprot:Sro334_g119790.1 n/a (294) ;mRNA; f:36600-37639